MLTVDTYTATWDLAMRPSPPRVNSLFRSPEYADAREWDGFRRTLKNNGLDFIWERHLPRLQMDVYRIVKVRV